MIGTNIGQTFNQGYGTGTSEIFDTSQIPSVARDIYAQENVWKKQEFAQNKQARQLAYKETNTPLDIWQRDAQILTPQKDALVEQAARLMTRVNDPFAPSADSEVMQFQRDWRDLQSKAMQSKNDRAEYSKYQDDLRNKGASAFDPTAISDIEGYYSGDINTRYGKTPSAMRLKDPNANAYAFASNLMKNSEKKEFTSEELDNLVNFHANTPETKAQIAVYGKDAFEGMSPSLKRAAMDKYGKDAGGNFDFIGLGKEVLREALGYTGNTEKIDVFDQLTKIGKESSDMTEKKRGRDGTIYLNKNAGIVADDVKTNISNLIQMKAQLSAGFKKSIMDYYVPKIKQDDSTTVKDLEEKVYALAAEDAYKVKDQSSQVMMRPTTVNKTYIGGAGEGNEGDLFAPFLQGLIKGSLSENALKWNAKDEKTGRTVSGNETPETRQLLRGTIDGRKPISVVLRQQDAKFGTEGMPYIRVQFETKNKIDPYSSDEQDFKDYYLDKPEDMQSIRDAFIGTYQTKGNKKEGNKTPNYKAEPQSNRFKLEDL